MRRLLALVVVLAMAADLPADPLEVQPEPIDEALGIKLSPSGLGFLANTAPALIPPTIPIPEINDTLNNACLLDDIDLRFYDAELAVDVASVSITPMTGSPGFLSLDLVVDVYGGKTDSVGGSTYDFVLGRLQYAGCLTNCDGNNYSLLRMFPPAAGTNSVSATANVTLELLDDPNSIFRIADANTDIAPQDVAVVLGNFNGQGCALASLIDDLVNCCLQGVIEDLIRDEVVNLIYSDLLPLIESSINDLRITEQVALLDSSIELTLYPSDVQIDDTGMLVAVGGLFRAAANICVQDRDPPALSGDPLPGFTGASPYDLALAIGEDPANQALWAAWRAGALCLELDELGGEPLSAELLTIAGLSRDLTRLEIPKNAPIVFTVDVDEPPTLAWNNAPAANTGTLTADPMRLGLIGPVHERQARIVTLDVELNAGVDLTVDAANTLSVAIALDSSNINASVGYNELLFDESATALSYLVPTLVSSFLPSLDTLVPPIDLSDLGGVGLAAPAFMVEGKYLSAYSGLTNPGTGCGGCNGLPFGTSAGLFLSAFVIAMLRRR